MLVAIPQILQLGTDDDGADGVDGTAAAVSALEKILDESSLAPGFRCREKGPSVTADGTRDEADDADEPVLVLPPALLADVANGFEFKSDVVNCNLGCRRILLPKMDVADARLGDDALDSRLDDTEDAERADGFTSF